MGIAFDRHLGEVLEGTSRPLRTDVTRPLIPPERLRNLEIEEVRSVKCRFCGDPRAHALALRRVEQELEDGRGVENDHRRSRS